MARRLVLDEVDSTNEEARRRARAGADAPLWILARRQSAGRGRRGRSWATPPGNLSATLLMRPAQGPAEAALHSFAACLAVADLFDAVAPGVEVALKWPNDALLGGRKAAGVLLESESAGRGLAWLAVGVGVNLAGAPESVEPEAWPPTSVFAETGRPPPAPEAALDILAPAFDRWAGLLAADGFAPLRAAWLARAARLGERVAARLPDETLEGRFADVDANGALVLETDRGVRRISAAEIQFS